MSAVASVYILRLGLTVVGVYVNERAAEAALVNEPDEEARENMVIETWEVQS
jgi:hypothetical protein